MMRGKFMQERFKYYIEKLKHRERMSKLIMGESLGNVMKLVLVLAALIAPGFISSCFWAYCHYDYKKHVYTIQKQNSVNSVPLCENNDTAAQGE
jgi:hypothetical protein